MGVARRVAVVVACVPVLVLAGCGDDEPAEPVELPSLSPSAGSLPGVSASQGAEDLPASEVEPAEFVRAWVDAYNAATLDGDTTRMRAMSAEECMTCDGFATQLEEIYGAGGSVDPVGPAHVIDSVDPESSDSTSARFTLKLTVSSGTTYETADGDPIEFSAEQQEWIVDLYVVGGSWRVAGIGV
ncbi:DUF6318 family protein [Nocardioides sp. AE5]|uniref:DUF6318 family protein n=1 Tax=Nocardioides sp. AE5 TaxID=2962573 RepID=UPI0028825443|nr:DUF6318 family protein [Nocardioides sp. AE5]MDT0203271.1 DUF6318 family protein [Nocardioides sp. AE5]